MEEAKKRKTFTSNEVKQRYEKKTYYRFGLRLRKVDDAELIAKLESVESANAYIKELIRADIEAEKK